MVEVGEEQRKRKKIAGTGARKMGFYLVIFIYFINTIDKTD
jgi:hypothetical protein